MKRRKIRFILAVFLICLEFGATFVQAGQKQREQQEEETRQKLMEDMELGQMQDAVNQILKEDSFSIEEILNQILKGESLFQKETMSKWFKKLLYYLHAFACIIDKIVWKYGSGVKRTSGKFYFIFKSFNAVLFSCGYGFLRKCDGNDFL